MIKNPLMVITGLTLAMALAAFAACLTLADTAEPYCLYRIGSHCVSNDLAPQLAG